MKKRPTTTRKTTLRIFIRALLTAAIGAITLIALVVGLVVLAAMVMEGVGV